MSEVIVAKRTGEEIRAVKYLEYDFEVGDSENTFLVTCHRTEWETVPEKARIYIPGTEFGGIFKRLETSTKPGTIAAGGITWRGLLQKKVIEPPAGADYATDAGELNAIIGRRVSAALPDLFVGSNESTGVTADYQYNRYVSLYDGLKAMLKKYGYRLKIAYSQDMAKVVVSAVPIVDYSDKIEYSSDMSVNYNMTMDQGGVNHLICLGQGELRDRTVVHLYVDADGNISQTQTFFGVDEICAVYDYAGASREDLIQSGIKQLESMGNYNSFQIDFDTERPVEVGDIVGGRDYISGMKMTAPITTKIARWRNGFESVEYKLSNELVVEAI